MSPLVSVYSQNLPTCESLSASESRAYGKQQEMPKVVSIFRERGKGVTVMAHSSTIIQAHFVVSVPLRGSDHPRLDGHHVIDARCPPEKASQVRFRSAPLTMQIRNPDA
jgi:hypothetical protein